MKGVCLKCGTIYAGWALMNPVLQMCGRCGGALDLYRDDIRVSRSDLPVIPDADKPCTFSVQIEVQSPGSGNPTGIVTFYDGGKTLGTGSLSSDGNVQFSISSLARGTHAITATYNGDDNFDGSNSSVVSQVIK